MDRTSEQLWAENLFDRDKVQIHEFESIPVSQEVSLMDEQWLKEFAPALHENSAELYTLGYHTPAIVNHVGEDALEMSVYFRAGRFHKIKALLPREKFVICVERGQYDIKPHVFVKGSWLTDLHLRHHSVFAIFDAIGVKKALGRGTLSSGQLQALRNAIDTIANEHTSVALISFADSLLVKTNYQIGQYDSTIRYSYEPEALLGLFPAISRAYSEVLGLSVYAVVTQGLNVYADGALIHISRDHNHISLNSLGLPFAQLLEMAEAVNVAIHDGSHAPADLYMDESFYHSLSFDGARFDKNERPKYRYEAPMDSAGSFYYAENFDTISRALRVNGAP